MGDDPVCHAVNTLFAPPGPPWLLPLLLLIFLYLVCGLLVLCDKWFVPTLERIKFLADLPDHLVGALLMGGGSSLTELFTSFADALGTRNSIGFGTIAGASIFNLLGNAGVAAIIANQALVITPAPFIRDCIFYAVAAGAMFYMLLDGQVTAGECYGLLGMYSVYVVAVLVQTPLTNFIHQANRGCMADSRDAKTGPLLEEMPTLSPQPADDLEPQASSPLFEFMSSPGFVCLCYPFVAIFNLTLPNPTTSGGVMTVYSFVVTALWIAVLSFGMAYSGSAIGCVTNVNSALIGITLVATATTLSGVFASSIVAKRGHGDMAMSNALGSNISVSYTHLTLPTKRIV
eukprot:TRINITY_DN20357_c0_g2_i3.p1 TRINITY_DN20357_c0_g2~~TRINITY_DN20357_c0_g2_i3.p1  ORF type:complete len:345 (-),score=77.52 TRINITY_DN20357_c0_g2_i3:55-1089(-)